MRSGERALQGKRSKAQPLKCKVRSCSRRSRAFILHRQPGTYFEIHLSRYRCWHVGLLSLFEEKNKLNAEICFMKESKNRYKNLSSIICIIAYVTAEFLTICSPSEAKNAILGSFSVFRIMLLVMNSCCAALVLWMLQQVRHRKGYLFPMQMIACFMIFLPFTILQVALLDTENTIFTIMKNRAWASLVFIFLCGITILTEAYASSNNTQPDPNIKYEFFISLALIVYSCIIGYFDKITLEKNFEYIGSFCLLEIGRAHV